MASQWQSVAVCGKVDHGRPRQSQVQPGTAGNSQDIKYDTERYIWGIKLGILWGMSGVLSGACLGHHLGHVWDIIWACLGHHLGHVWGIILGTSDSLGHHLKACLGQSKISAVLHASLMPFGSSGGVIVVVVAMVVVVLYSGGGSTLASRPPPVSMLALWALWVQNYFTALFS